MAATFKRIFRQDLTKPLQIYYNLELVFSKDNLANEIQIELYNGSDVYSGGGSVSGTAIRADGRTVPLENGTISGNVVTVALTEACMEIPGTLQVYVKLTSGDVKTTVFAGVFTAVRTETGTVIDPGTIIPSVTDLINQIDAAIDSIPADYSTLLGSLASTYSASKTYAVGDYVWYDGALYRCTTAITTAESWTAAHWSRAVLGDDVTSLKSAFDDVLRTTVSLSPTWERGNINSSGNNANSGRYVRSAEPITINGDTLTVDLDLSYSADPIATVVVYDSTGAYVSSLRKNYTTSGEHTLAIPSGYKVRFLIGCGSHDTETVVSVEDGDSILQASYSGYASLDTDDTLTIAGRAADAKTVGDALGEVNDSIDAIEGDISDLQSVLTLDNRIDFTWEKGYISSSGAGGGSTSTTRIRTKTWYQMPKSSFKLYIPTGIRCRVCVYSDNTQASYIGPTNYDGTNDFITINITAGYWIKLWISYYPTESDIAMSVGDSIYAVYTEGINDTTEELVTAQNIDKTVSWMSFSMFWKVGVIGDSFASGSLHHPDDDGWTGNYDLSWPQILARQTGADVINFTKGGLSTKTWLENATYGLTALLAADPQQLYIIALGINDNTQIQAGTLTLGTVADIKDDYTQNPDTFYGDYARIIGNIKAHAPYAKIVCLSVMRPQERGMDQYIAEIAEACGVPFINILEDDYFTSDVYYGSMYSSHPIAYGYAGTASAVERLISRCVLANTAYFGTYYGLLDDDSSGDPDESAV